MKIFRNDVLVLEIDNYGILKEKGFITWKIEKIKVVENTLKHLLQGVIHL